MKQLSKATMEHWREIRAACLANAEELVNSAKFLKGKNTAHIRFHFAVLAMEEVGKAVLTSIEFAKLTFDDDIEPNLTIDDHVKKFFWAIFSPSIEQQRLTKEDFELWREFARETHEISLESLYTNPQVPLLPQDRVEEEAADGLVELAESRINLEKTVDISDTPDEARLEDFHWFHTASNDPEKRRFIFGNTSWNKRVELKNVHEWIKWLRQEFTKAEEESREILQQEIEKGAGLLQELVADGVGEVEDNGPKWRVKFRIYSESHSIRPKVLSAWNKTLGYFVKLSKSNKKRKDELICELTLGKRVPVQGLWNAGWAMSRYFVAALNIATMGLFWWHVDKDRARFYEKIWDLENNAEPQIEIPPEMIIDWGGQALTEADFRNTRFIIGYLLKDIHFNPRKGEALEIYLTGLALISKSDVHLRLEADAFEHFFQTLKTLLLASGDWDGVEDLKLAAETQLGEIFSTVPNSETPSSETPSSEMPSLSDCIEWGMQLEKRNNPSKQITLTEAIDMKFYCDVYFFLLAKRELNNRTERNL